MALRGFFNTAMTTLCTESDIPAGAFAPLRMTPLISDVDTDPKRVNEWLALAGTALVVLLWFRAKLLFIAKYVFQIYQLPDRVMALETRTEQQETSIRLSIGMSTALMQSSKRCIWRSSADGRCVFANRFMLRTLKRDLVDVLGMAWLSFIHEDDRDRVFAEWKQSVANSTDFDLKYRWVTGTGEILHVHAVAERIFSEEGVPMGYVAFVDILDVSAFRA